MEAIEKLLDKIKNEKNINSKIFYLDEMIKMGEIIKDLHYIECTSILKDNKNN